MVRRRHRNANQYTSTRTAVPARNQVTASTIAAAVDADSGLEDIAWQFHPDNQAWRTNGFGTWESARPWIDRQFTADQANTWKTFGFGPDAAQQWRDSGLVDPGIADTWRQEGFDPGKAAEWRSFVFDAYSATTAIENGFGDPADAFRWYTTLRAALNGVGVSNETMVWEFIARYRDNGITPDQAVNMIRRKEERPS